MREQYANHVQRLPELTREIETERQEKEKIKQNEEILQQKLEQAISQLQQLQEIENSIREESQNNDRKYQEQCDIVQAMQNAQLELKRLIEEERQAYNEDRERYELDVETSKQCAETKVKIIKTKLIALYDGNIDQAKNLSIEEIIDHISFRVNHSSQINNATQASSSISNKRGSSHQTQSRANRHLESPSGHAQSNQMCSDFFDGQGMMQDQKITTSH